MKSLLIIRHAKSNIDIDLDDFDRTLNNRGHKDAQDMAQRLIKKEIRIDKFISSPAKRALTTAAYFAKAYQVAEGEILQIPNLYEPGQDAFVDAILSIDDEVNTAAVFSHNPGITYFVNSLTEAKIDNMPTCAVFGVKIDCNHWKDILHSKITFWFFDYPKAV